MFDLNLSAILGALLALVSAAFGVVWKSRNAHKREAEEAKSKVDVERRSRESDKAIDQKIREAEGDNDARDARVTDANNF